MATSALYGISTLHCLLLLFFLSPSILQFAVAQQPPNTSPSSVDEDDYNFDAAKVNPSMAVIIIVVVLVFFITGFIALYIHQCSDSSTAGGALVAATSGRFSRRGNVRGLENSVIETFPTFLYSEVKELKVGKGTLECAVCLNEFEEDETLRLLPTCDHVFHSECIDAWLSGHATCPVCRANLVPIPSQIGKVDESTIEIGVDVEGEGLPHGGGIPTCEVRIVIDEGENKGVKKESRKVNGKLPRSHSTGHSLSQLGGVDSERYRLKLPAEVRRQLVARTKLKRTTSLVGLPRAPSSRRGYRGGGEGSGSSRYGGSIIGRSISRMVSFKWVPKASADGDVKEMSRGSNSKRILSSAVTPWEG